MLRRFRRIDLAVFLPTLSASVVGLIFIASASKNMGSPPPPYYERQLLWLLISLLSYLLLCQLSIERLKRLAPPLFISSLLLLLIVLIAGTPYRGARRWLTLGWCNIQPSEFMKVSFIVFMPLIIIDGKARRLKNLLLFFGITSVVVLLVAVEPDLGTSLVFLPVALLIVATAGAKKRHLLLFLLLLCVAAPVGWWHLRPYQKRRVLAFLDPDINQLSDNYQLKQAKVAIGSGGLFGKGYGRGTHNALNLLPARHTDFIFSLVAEEWGFSGSLLVLGLLFSLVFLCLSTAVYANSEYTRLVAVGVAGLLFIQTTVNVAMNLGLAPITGIPLPFLTYGGSSTLSLWGIASALSLVRLNDAPSLVRIHRAT